MTRVIYRHNILTINSIDEFLNVKGGYNNNTRDVYFVRAIGELRDIQKSTHDMDKKMDTEMSLSRLKYIRISTLPKLMNIEDSNYYMGIYAKWEQGHIGGFRNIILNAELKEALSHALRKVCDEYKEFGKAISYSIIKNFAVKLFFWLDTLMAEVLKDWNEKSIIKVIADNVIKEQEYLFYLFLSFIGCDVLLIQNREDTQAAEGLLKYSQKLVLGTYGTTVLNPYVKSITNTAAERLNYTREATASNRVVIPPRPNRKKQGLATAPASTASANGAVQRAVTNNPASINTVNARQEKSFEELAKLASSVVLIAIHDARGEVIGTGSGIMIGKGGFILTNNHVAAGGSYYSVRIEDDEKVYSTTELIKYNQVTDLAVIRIKRELTPIPIYGGEKELVRGQKVVAIGSPLGLFNSVSDGIISGFRNIKNIDMIQFTAPISSGSSGGAVLNMYGEVIGISTAGFDGGQNINLAVGYENIRQFTNGFRS